jgi:hypothetical protein
MSQVVEWLKNHSHAILGTIVFLQNSHLLGAKAEGVMKVISDLFSAMGGT